LLAGFNYTFFVSNHPKIVQVLVIYHDEINALIFDE
jgi:hypothetical protein